MLLILVPVLLLVIFLAPSRKARFVLSVYSVMLFMVLWGLEGFIYSESPSVNERYAYWAFLIFVLVLHLPFIIRLFQLDVKKNKVKNARSMFDKDVKHLTDEQLHRHLEHGH